jgi:hypothetical protein
MNPAHSSHVRAASAPEWTGPSWADLRHLRWPCGHYQRDDRPGCRTTQTGCSASSVSERRWLPRCWRRCQSQVFCVGVVRLSPTRGSIRATTVPAPRSTARRASPKSATRRCGRRSTCRRMRFNPAVAALVARLKSAGRLKRKQIVVAVMRKPRAILRVARDRATISHRLPGNRCNR